MNLIDSMFNELDNVKHIDAEQNVLLQAKLRTQIDELRAYTRKIKDLENHLVELKSYHMKLAQVSIPDTLMELGITPENYVEKTDNYIFSCKKKYFASISKEKKDAAIGWLRDNGYEDIIKVDVVIPVGRDPVVLAETMSKLDVNNVKYNLNEGVHHSTLKAFVREQLEKGEDLNFDLLGIHIVNEAEIKDL